MFLVCAEFKCVTDCTHISFWYIAKGWVMSSQAGMGEQSTPCRWGVVRGVANLFGGLKAPVEVKHLLRERFSLLFEPDTPEDVSEASTRQYFGEAVFAEFQAGSSHDGMDLDPLATSPHDRELYLTPEDFQDEDVLWETSHAIPPPVDDRTELEPCVCGQGCLRCQARQIIISRPSTSIGRMHPTYPWFGEGMLRRRGWKIAAGMFTAYRNFSGLLSQIRLRRTVTAEITPATSSRTPGTRRRIFTLRSPSGYTGIRPRRDKWVCEMRISGKNEKVWLGSYDTEKEAALAYDAGLHHCSSTRRARQYNFSSSPRLLGPQARLEHLSSADRKAIVKMIAEEYARNHSTIQIQ